MAEYKLKIQGKEQFTIKEIGDIKLNSDDLLTLENAIESKIELEAQIAYENMIAEKKEEQDKAMRFFIKCVDAKGKDVQYIDDMCEESVEITSKVFKKNLADLAELEDLFPCYSWTNKGLQLWNDPCVTFYKSKYNGQDCVYLTQSGIEYVFLKVGVDTGDIEDMHE